MGRIATGGDDSYGRRFGAGGCVGGASSNGVDGSDNWSVGGIGPPARDGDGPDNCSGGAKRAGRWDCIPRDPPPNALPWTSRRTSGASLSYARRENGADMGVNDREGEDLISTRTENVRTYYEVHPLLRKMAPKRREQRHGKTGQTEPCAHQPPGGLPGLAPAWRS